MQPKNENAKLNDAELIAPCGINCRLCRAYMRERKPCPGCRGRDENKSKTCINCRIRNCRELALHNHRYCFSCAAFPCHLLRRLDVRYSKNYGVSVIANLEFIRQEGIARFLMEERTKWTCDECGAVICMHKAQCENCGTPR